MASSNHNQKELTRDEGIAKLAKMIKGIRVAMMTTVDPNGILSSRPMATQDADFDGQLWFFTRDDSGKVHSIESEQHVNIAYADPDKQHFVSISGRARLVNDRQKMQQLWNPALKAWFPNGLDDAHIGLIEVDVDSALIWDSPSSAIVHLVGLAKAMVTGRPYDQKAHTERVDLKH